MLISSCIVYGCFHAMAELSSCGRDHMAVKLNIFIIWPFTEFAEPLFNLIVTTTCFLYLFKDCHGFLYDWKIS
jgi:hypothetical protein